MTDAKLRELFTVKLIGSDDKTYIASEDGEFIKRMRFKDDTVFKVREISPELDAAVKQMVEALEQHPCTCPIISRYDSSTCKRCEALDAYRRATEIGK